MTQVTITNVTISGSTATITVNPDPGVISKNSAGVHWNFAQSGYEFVAADGVTFKPNQPAGPIASAPAASAGEYQWCFNSTVDSTWRYTIKFKATGSSTIWSCDPTIANSSTLATTAPASFNCVAIS